MKVLMIDQIAKVNYKYSFSLAEAIKKQGIDIDLVIDQKQEKEKCTCKIRRLFNSDEKDIGKFAKLLNYIKSYREILYLCKENQYDVLHTQWLLFSPLDYYYINKIKKKYGVKLVVTIHDILPFNEKFYDKRYHQKVYAIADEIIVQAETNINRFLELFPDVNTNVTLIPHGHFLDYAEIVPQEQGRQFFGLKDEFVFLFFGQIKKVKGVDVLLEAFGKIYEKYPNFRLIVAGSVWKDDFSKYQEIIDAYNMQESVITHIKYIPDNEVKYYYAACDVCVLPYRDVYQSGVVQLSYAHKKVVIASDIAAFKEVVIDNETGYLCEVNNADSLAEKMVLSYEGKSQLVNKAEMGYQYIEKKFSWVEIAGNIKKIYVEILGK